MRVALVVVAAVAACSKQGERQVQTRSGASEGSASPQTTPTVTALDVYRRAIGASPGAPGTLFTGIVPGVVVTDLIAIRKLESDVSALTMHDAGAPPVRVEITTPGGEPGPIEQLAVYSPIVDCAEVEAMLVAAWSKPQTFDDYLVWTDRGGKSHAALDRRPERACRLAFWPWTTPDAWLDDARSPLALIGSPSKDLVAVLGGAARTSRTSAEWRAPALGIGVEDVFCSAAIDEPAVHYVMCEGLALAEINDELATLLEKRFGKPGRGNKGAKTWVSKQPAFKIDLSRGESRWGLILSTKMAR